MKHFKDEGDEVFFSKSMNPDVEPEIERLKRITMADGIGSEDTSRTVVAIAYWAHLNISRQLEGFRDRKGNSRYGEKRGTTFYNW